MESLKGDEALPSPKDSALQPPLPPLLAAVRELLEQQRACQKHAELHLSDIGKRISLLERDFSTIVEDGRARTVVSPRSPPLASYANGSVALGSPEAAAAAADVLSLSSVTPPYGRPLSLARPSPESLPLDSENDSVGGRRRLTARGSRILELAVDEADDLGQTQTARTRTPPAWVLAVRSSKFDLLVGLVIILNTIVMALQLEHDGMRYGQILRGVCSVETCVVPWVFHDGFFVLMENIFTGIFLVELVLRLAADGCRYLWQGSNFLDALIVLLSIMDSWVLQPLGNGGAANVSTLRLIRLMRLSKVLRVMRVMKAFAPLRVLVTTMYNSFGALMWSMSLLFMLELIGSIFLAQTIHGYIDDAEVAVESRRKVWQRFGTWSRAMFSVFEMTMAPGGFLQYRPMIEEVNPLVGIFIVLYSCIVTFAVIRVITALFLRATLAACDFDDKETASRTALDRNEFATRLKEKVDANGSGGIDAEEFSLLLEIPQMQEWIAEIGMNSSEAMRLFRSLDMGNGEVDFQDLLAALTDMRGPQRPCTSVVLSNEIRLILDYVTQLTQLTQAAGSAGCRIQREAFPEPAPAAPKHMTL